MSRIADVLQKARRENGGRAQPGASFDPGDQELLRAIAQVEIPWILEGPPKTAPRSSVVRPILEPVADQFPRGTSTSRQKPHAAPVVEDAIADLVGRLFVTAENDATAVRRVLFTAVNDPSGSDPSGSAEIARQVAEALAAQSTGSVCLVDMDLHRPTLHEHFKLGGKPGFSDAVVEGDAPRTCAHQAASVANLLVMPAGSRPLAAGQVLEALETQRRLEGLLGAFDYVVGCSAAIGVHPDATMIGTSFDGVVLVAERNTTKAEEVRAAAASLQEVRARLLGTVMREAEVS